MHIKINKNSNILSAWNKLLLAEKNSSDLSELDFSALSSWLPDIDRSYSNIYLKLLRKIENADINDAELLYDCVDEIYSDLEHIRDHIEAAERGFSELMRVLAAKSEQNRE